MAFPEPQVIVRRVLVRIPGDRDAKAVLDAVADVACGDKWTATLSRYDLSTAGCRRQHEARAGDATRAIPQRRQ
jgi:polar amino acid transport system substrate-binding protein